MTTSMTRSISNFLLIIVMVIISSFIPLSSVPQVAEDEEDMIDDLTISDEEMKDLEVIEKNEGHVLYNDPQNNRGICVYFADTSKNERAAVQMIYRYDHYDVSDFTSFFDRHFTDTQIDRTWSFTPDHKEYYYMIQIVEPADTEEAFYIMIQKKDSS